MREFARGDVEGIMAAAPVRIGGRFRFHRKTPLAIENRACLAEYDRGRRSLTLTVSTQIPGVVRDLLADLLKLPGHSVRVVAPDVGGAAALVEGIPISGGDLAAVLAHHLGRSVCWTGDRQEDLSSTSHGFDEIVDAELALDRDGCILGLTAEVIGDVGAYSILPVDGGSRAGPGRQLHARPLPRSDLPRGQRALAVCDRTYTDRFLKTDPII